MEAFFAASDDGPEVTATCHNILTFAWWQSWVFQWDIFDFSVAVGSYATAVCPEATILALYSMRVENVQFVTFVLICNQVSNLIKSAIKVTATVQWIRKNSLFEAHEVGD